MKQFLPHLVFSRWGFLLNKYKDYGRVNEEIEDSEVEEGSR